MTEPKRIPEHEWTGPVYVEGWETDGFFSNMDELRSLCRSNQIALPELIRPCDQERLDLDAEWIVESAMEAQAFWPEAYQLYDIVGLQKLLDEWIGRHEVYQYTPLPDQVIEEAT